MAAVVSPTPLSGDPPRVGRTAGAANASGCYCIQWWTEATTMEINAMRIQVNTDNRVQNGSELREHAESTVRGALSRFGDAVTRVEVHLTDENADKAGGDDKRCVIEARLSGRDPVAVAHSASVFEQAINGASAKLLRRLDRELGRLSRR